LINQGDLEAYFTQPSLIFSFFGVFLLFLIIFDSLPVEGAKMGNFFHREGLGDKFDLDFAAFFEHTL